MDEGQYQAELGNKQFGSRPEDGLGKKSPFAPVSMKPL
jgi:hypothetical protein